MTINHHDLLDTPVIGLSHHKEHGALGISFVDHPTQIYAYDYLLTRMEVDPLLKTIPQQLKEKIHMLVFAIKNHGGQS